LKIATYNVNSIRAREARVIDWLEQTQPDIVCLQELKVDDETFPSLVFAGMGYSAAVWGQKTYNGVAILSKTPLTDVTRGFGDDDPDEQARFISAKTRGITIMSAYFPNGESLQSDKFKYKLRWIDRLTAHVMQRIARGEQLVLAGDYNIAPAALDCYDPIAWNENVLFSTAERAAFQKLLDLGLCDVVRRVHPETPSYTWWDYRMLGFQKNRGLRIDHVLVARGLEARIEDAGVDREERKGKQPSDHAPVWVRLADE
jgi:exodeoxyribonuclease-3